MVKYLAKGYLWALLLLLYSPILIIMILSLIHISEPTRPY